MGPRLDEQHAKALGRMWLEDALSEHASIASFARATLELMAVGAPPDLLVGCQRSGIEEVRHAELCFRLARRFSGEALDPGPLPAVTLRRGGLAAIARDTFLEGCAGETIAAWQATRALEGVRDAEVRRAITRIVRDETRHAELAWRTLAWTVREGGAPVRAAVARTARAFARKLAAARPRRWPRRLSARTLAAYGRLAPEVELASARQAFAEVVTPALELLLGGLHVATA